MVKRKLDGITIGGTIMAVNGEWWVIEYNRRLKNKWSMGKTMRKWCENLDEAREYALSHKHKWMQAEIFKLNEADKPVKAGSVGISGDWLSRSLSVDQMFGSNSGMVEWGGVSR